MIAFARGPGELRHSLLTLAQRGRWLVVTFREPVRACSWAIVGGGITQTSHVAWLEVRDADLKPPVDARAMLRDRLRSEGIEGAVGLLTSRSVATYAYVADEEQGSSAACIATVGLGNALRAGDPPGALARIGTINMLVHVSAPLSDEALLEASTIAAEAKCAAVMEAGIVSRHTGRPATGTGTDCTVITAARAKGRRAARYAGKHTVMGSLVGRVVERAVTIGARRWKNERSA